MTHTSKRSLRSAYFVSASALLIAGCSGGLAGDESVGSTEDVGSVSSAVVNTTSTYELKAVHSGKCLEIGNNSTADGGNAQQWTCVGSSSQRFKFEDMGGGYYRIKNVNSGKCLDVWGYSSTDGANIAQYTCGTAYNQQFQVVDDGGGVHHFLARHSGKAIDVSGVSTADGANVQQWAWTSGNNQKFNVVDVGGGGGTGTGLTGTYFDNRDFTVQKLQRTDATVNFSWGTAAPDASMGTDTFAVRWSGKIKPLYSQTYTFYTNSDDGVRVWVNNQLVIDKWFNQGGTTEYSGTIALTAGTQYDIRVDYYDDTGGASLALRWSSASQAKQIIPQSQLYPAPPNTIFNECRFHFGTIDEFARNNAGIRAEIDYFVPGWMGLSTTFDQQYVCDEANGILAGKVPVIVSYTAAFYSKIQKGRCDCNVYTCGTNNDLCTYGAADIKQNLTTIVNIYKSYAQGYAACYGTTKPIVFEMEPDWYQYTYPSQTSPMTNAESASIMGQFVAAIQQYLPNARFSMDISPWVAPNNGSDNGASWYSNFNMNPFTFVNTSGGGTEGANTLIRSTNNMTWAGVSSVTGKAVLADTGYGVAGVPTGHDDNWDSATNINARMASGVSGVAQYNPKSTWGTTLQSVRSQLGTPKFCP
jgi:hypothetical protein